MRIGFLGTGLIAWAHSMVLGAISRAGIVDLSLGSCYDVDEARAASFAAAHGCRRVQSAEEVVEESDVLWLCTSTGGHLPLARLVCEAGKPLFCEKPLGRSLDEARNIAGFVESSGIASQVGLVLRTCPVFIEFKAVVEEGRFGRLMALQMRDDQFFPITGHYGSTWRADVAEAGGGTVIEHSIHDLDVLQYCAGPIRGVSAVTGNFAGHLGVEDLAVCTLNFDGDAAGSLTSVWHRITSRGSTRRVEAIFEEAIVDFDTDFVGPLRIEHASGEELRPCDPLGWVRDLPLPEGEIGLAIRMYAVEDRSFLDALSEGRMPTPTIPEGVGAHQLVEAVYRSATSGGSGVDPRSI